jgi:hypothetical protein
MEHSYANDLSITLRAPNGSEVTLKIEGDGLIGSNPNNSVDMGEPVSSGRVDQWNASNITPGIGYEYVWNSDPTYNTMSYMVDNQLLPEHTYISTWGNELTDYYYPEGSYTPEENFNDFIGTELNGEWTIIVTDFYILDNGYIFEWGVSLSSPQSDSIITISEPGLPVVTDVETEPDCGLSNGSIDITVVGDQSPYEYLWSTGTTSEDLIDIPAGPYNVQITGGDNCLYDYNFTLSDNGTLVLDASIEDETCIDADDGSIDLTVNGGTPSYNFIWSGGQTTEDITDLAPGEYIVTVDDAGNCSAVESYIVNEAVPLFVSAIVTDENCGDQEGAIDITICGGVEPYVFVWSTGETSEDIDELAQGVYTVTVSDANGCTKQESFQIINYVGNCIPDCDLEITNSEITDELCGQGNGSVDITVFTSNSPFTFLWSDGSTTEDISALSAGEYTVTITDNEACELTETFTVENETGNLSIVETETTNEVCGNGSGAVNITVNGGALPYAFLWNTGDVTEDLTNIHEGSYSVVITDANGCSVSTSAEVINEAGDLELAWSYTMNETCGNGEGSIDILIEGGNPFYGGPFNPDYYLYQWSNGATSEDLNNINEGTYQCIITDEDGCQISTPEFFVENVSGDMAFDNIDIDNETCGNAEGEIELFVTGGEGTYSYLWSTGETDYAIYNLSEGTYSAQVTDANGCLIETGNIQIVNEAGTLSLDGLITTDEICGNNQGSVNVALSGGTVPYNSLWNTGSTSEDLLNIGEGNYTCIVTDADGCEINFGTTVFNDQGTLEVLNTVITDEMCGGGNGMIDLIITGGSSPYTYYWSNGETTEDIGSLSAGIYTCIITDAQGCQANAYAEVENESGTLSLNNYILTNEQCGGGNGAIDLIVSGGALPLSYNWNNGATTEDLTGISAGTYSCEITDALGCVLNAGPYTINNTSSTMFVNYSVTDETCGNGNGSIDISITGGTEPYTFLWNTGATTEDLFDLQAGTYIYTITDNAGCSLSGEIDIVNNSGDLDLTGFTATDEICSNGTGEIDIMITGGLEPYIFLWNNGATTEDITGLSAGTYNVTITDDNGCEISSQNINVNNNPGNFELSSVIVTNDVCDNGTGSVNVSLTGGSNPISYLWSTGDITKDISGLNQGVYSCVAVDNNGCELSYSAVVGNNSGDLSATVDNVNPATCGEENGAIEITVTGGTEPYSFSWSNGATTEDLSDLPGGNYSCFITDDLGCTSTIFSVVEDIGGDFDVSILSVTDEQCNNANGAVDVSVFGGTEPYSYLWSNGATTQDITNLSEGLYELTVNDDFGCVLTTSAFVDNIESDLLIENADVTNEVCDNGQGMIDITVNLGMPPYSFLWSNGATTEDLTNISTGNYSVTITDNAGCSVNDSYFVDNEESTVGVTNVNINSEMCGMSNGAIDITPDGGTEPYTFLWNTGATTEDISNLTQGEYTVTISDANGCDAFEIFNVNNIITLDISSEAGNELCGQSNGYIDITINDAFGTVSFDWSNGATTEDLLDIPAGIYSCDVSDDAGCTEDVYYEIINETGDMAVTATVTDDYCGDGGSIELDITGTTAGYSVLWSNGSSDEDIFGLAAGSYSVEVTDLSNNCVFYDTYEIETFGVYTVSEVITNSSCQTCDDGAIDLTPEPVDNYTFQWSNGEDTEDISGLLPGDYTVIINNMYDCEFTETYTVDYEVSVSDFGSIGLKIYPNPTDGILKVEYASLKEQSNLSITNIVGKKVYENTVFEKEGLTELDISSYATGIYFLTIENKDQRKTIKLFKHNK